MVGKFESRKDVVQDLTESAAHRLGNIATIITGAVKDVTREVGDFVTDSIEMREAAARAVEDHDAGDDRTGIDKHRIDRRGTDSD